MSFSAFFVKGNGNSSLAPLHLLATLCFCFTLTLTMRGWVGYLLFDGALFSPLCIGSSMIIGKSYICCNNSRTLRNTHFLHTWHLQLQ